MTLLRDKIVLVTGGGGLIGSALCNAIAAAGGISLVADIDIGKAESVVHDITDTDGYRAEAVTMDITDPDSVRSVVEAMTDRHGRIDGLVNNAYPRNANYGRRLEEVKLSDFNANTNMHLGGYFLTMQIFAKAFEAQGSGAIVNMSSIYGCMAPRFDVYAGTDMTMPVEYASIKAGVLHLTRYFAQYYKKAGVRVNAVSPGGVEDGQDPAFLERYNLHAGQIGMLSQADVTAVVVFALSDMARAITGQNLIVDDGFSL